jgi:hypothetical protein
MKRRTFIVGLGATVVSSFAARADHVHRRWRKVKHTERRAAKDYAECMRDLVDIHYPDAETIRVVQDNLSTHSAGALYQTFPPTEARRILRRIEFHYTPKHASWLSTWLRSRSVSCEDSASLAGSTTPSDCVAKSPLGNGREMLPAQASNGCSRRKKPAQKWGEPTQTLPKSHNHCAEVLVWCDVNAVEACGFDGPFHDADPLRLADDLRNFSLSFG